MKTKNIQIATITSEAARRGTYWIFQQGGQAQEKSIRLLNAADGSIQEDKFIKVQGNDDMGKKLGMSVFHEKMSFKRKIGKKKSAGKNPNSQLLLLGLNRYIQVWFLPACF